MSFTSIGSLGSANDKTGANNFITMSPSRAVAVGRIVVVWVAYDSEFNVGVPTTGWNFYKVNDTAGNVYTNIAAEVDTQAAFSEGAYCGIYVTQVRSALSTSDDITVTSEPGAVGLLIAKAISVEEYSIATGMRWAMAGPIYIGEEIRGVQPPALGFDTLFTQEWLWLYGLGVEGPNTDTYTWDADYTQIAGDGTTGGADDSNIYIRGGYRIATLQADTVDVTNDTSSTRDAVHALTAICEVPPQAFPTQPILDDFNRANENPLDNGTWNTVDTARGSAFAQLISNEAAGAGGSFWDEIFEDCVEVYATIETYLDVTDIHAHASGDADIGNMDGYGVAWTTNDVHVVGGNHALIGRSGLVGNVDGLSHVWADGADGFKFGLQRILDTTRVIPVHHLWMDIGAGWEEIAAIFMQGFQGIAYTSGKLGLGLGATTRVDDFGGGEIVCIQGRPQIMRYR